MPHLYGDSLARGVMLRSDAEEVQSRLRWQLDKLVGSKGPEGGGVSFSVFAQKYFPTASADMAAELGAIPELTAGQQAKLTEAAMALLKQAHQHSNSFYQDHRDSLSRRTSEMITHSSGQELKHVMRTTAHRVADGVRGRESEYHYRPEINHQLWDTGTLESPYNQACASMAKNMLTGFLARVRQEAGSGGGSLLDMVDQASQAQEIELSEVLPLLREAHQGDGQYMPYVLHEPNNHASIECRMAKEAFASEVLKAFQQPKPELVNMHADKIAAIVTKTQEKIIDLLVSMRETVTDHTAVVDGMFEHRPGTNPSSHIQSEMKKIMKELRKEVQKECGSWVGLGPDQSHIKDIQVAAGIDRVWNPVFNSGNALALATGSLGLGLRAAAVANPALGGVASAVYGIGTRIGGLAANAGIQHWAGAHVQNWAGSEMNWPSLAAKPIFDSTRKITDLKTSQILAKAADKCQLSEIQGELTRLTPKVQTRMADNQRLWAGVSSGKFKQLACVVEALLRNKEALQEVQIVLPPLLKDATLAHARDPALFSDLLTRLAQYADPTGQLDGDAAMDSLFNAMRTQFTQAPNQTQAALNLHSVVFAEMLDDNSSEGSPPVTDPKAMLGSQPAAAQMVVSDSDAMKVMRQAITQTLEGGRADQIETSIQKFIWGNMFSGVVQALALSAIGAGVAAGTAGAMGPVAAGAVGLGVTTAGNVVGAALRRAQIGGITVDGMQMGAALGASAPKANPLDSKNVLAQDIKDLLNTNGVNHSRLMDIEYKQAMGRWLQNQGTKLTEHASDLGRTKMACLLEHARSRDGLEALHQVDVNGAKQNHTNNKVQADNATEAKILKNRYRIEDALQKLDDGAPTKLWAHQKLEGLGVVKKHKQDAANHQNEKGMYQTRHDHAVSTLKNTLLAHLPTDAAGQPQKMLSQSDFLEMQAFLTHPNQWGNPQVLNLLAAIQPWVGDEGPGVTKWLKDNHYREAGRLDRYEGHENKVMGRLKNELRQLNEDFGHFGKGDFDKVQDPSGFLREMSVGFNNQYTVKNSYNNDYDYTQNRAIGLVAGSVALGGAMGLVQYTGDGITLGNAVTTAAGGDPLPLPGVNQNGFRFGVGNALGAVAAGTASPMSAFSGGGNMTTHTARPGDNTNAALEMSKLLTGDLLPHLSFAGTKKVRSFNLDGTRPHPSSVGAGNRIGNPAKKLGFPPDMSGTLLKDTASSSGAVALQKLRSGKTYQDIGNMFYADFISYRNMGARRVATEVHLEAKQIVAAKAAVTGGTERSPSDPGEGTSSSTVEAALQRASSMRRSGTTSTLVRNSGSEDEQITRF